jgi:hypothetical protein
MGGAANNGDVTTPRIEGLFHAPGRAELWRNASGAANTVFVATFVATGVVLAGVPAAREIAVNLPGLGWNISGAPNAKAALAFCS